MPAAGIMSTMRSKSTYKNSGLPNRKGRVKTVKAPSTLPIPAQKRPERAWQAYDKHLENRGNVTMYFSRTLLQNWKTSNNTGRRGRDKYHPMVIELGYMLRNLYRQPWRQTTGLLRGLLKTMGYGHLPVPHHTTWGKRAEDVSFKPVGLRAGNVLLVDGTGISTHTSGAWNRLKHKINSRQRFVKVVVTTDSATGMVMSVAAGDDTGAGTGELSQLPGLLDSLPEGYNPRFLVGDGAYDNHKAYDEAKKHNMVLVAPPRVNATIGKHPERNVTLTQVNRLGSVEWKKRRGYHQRSRVEVSIGALKQSLGHTTTAKSLEAGVADVYTRVNLYNRWVGQEQVNM